MTELSHGANQTLFCDSSDVRALFHGVQQVQATNEALAAILADGSVVAWGEPDFGGDSSEVEDQLKCVQQVQANYYAFAAILADESVVTWGFPDSGSDSSDVATQLADETLFPLVLKRS